MAREKLDFKMSIELNLNGFLLKVLRLSIVEITLWVYKIMQTRIIIIFFNLSE